MTDTLVIGDNIVFGAFCLALVLSACLLYLFFGRLRWHRGRSYRWLRLAAGNALVLGFLCSLLLLGGECYYRFFYDESDAYAMSRAAQAWFARHWHLNNQGLRDSAPVYAARDPHKHHRITFLGDSFTTGHGIADVERRFGNLIRNRRPDLQVDVIAENGYDTGDELGALGVLLDHHYQFDVVVLVYNLNDVSDMLPLRNEITKAAYHSAPSPVMHSYFLNMLWVRWRTSHDPVLAGYYSAIASGYKGNYWGIQQERLTQLRGTVEDAHGRLLVVTFPLLGNLGPDYPYRAIHTQLDEFWHRQGVPNLDLLGVLEPHRSEGLIVNPRDPHPNERAHELAAAAIERFIDQQVGDGHGPEDSH